MKTCRICRETKPYDQFYREKSARDGYRTECRTCSLAYKARRHSENPKPARERAKKWNRANPERVKERMRQYRDDGKKKVADRKSHLKRTYGLTVEAYDAMLAAQGGVCAICQEPPRDGRVLHVDHDHERGHVRGLLHFTCNNLLGDATDDSSVLRAAADYLEGTEPETEQLNEVARERAFALVASP